jgi:hypothetical protein
MGRCPHVARQWDADVKAEQKRHLAVALALGERP